jgi:DNA-directed RNA polymerase
MLVRAASRKTRLGTIRNKISFKQLYLPWLCPAHCRPQGEQHRFSSTAAIHPICGSPPKKRRNSNNSPNIPSRRSLATAVDRPFDDIPFVGLNSPTLPNPSASYGNSTPLSTLKPFDYSASLPLGTSLATPPTRYRNGKLGIGGDLSEILSILRACLQVGRIERAGVILKRVEKLEAVNEEQLLELHNEYLQAAVYQLSMKPSGSAAQALHKWFELEIRHMALPLNAETIAYMLKASLQSPPGDRRNRLVRRYMDIGKQKDLGLQILSSETLSAEDLNDITHICTDYNAEGPDFDDYFEVTESDSVEMPNEESPGLDPFVASVRPTKQKGLGLRSLKQTLSLFSRDSAADLNIADNTPEGKRRIQTQLEQDAVDSAIERWREENTHLTKMGFNTGLQTKSLGARMWKWHSALEDALKEELIKVDEAEVRERKLLPDIERCAYGPFLRILPTEKLAAVTILSTMTALGSHGVDKGLTLSNAIMTIAKNVEEESMFESVQSNRNMKALWGSKKGGMKRMTKEDLKRTIRSGHFESANHGAHAVSGDDSTAEMFTQRSWPITIKAKVGAFLMSALIETAKIPVTLEHPDTKELVTQMQPAFSHSHQYKMGKKVGIILANNAVVKQLKREPVHSLLAKHLPMLVTPDPWTRFNKGGFISHPSKMMRIKLGDKDQRHYAEAAIDKGDMQQTFKGLDVLGKTSWRINQPVFDVMLEAWNSGEGVANIAPENPKFELPPEPEASKDPLERRRWIRAVKLVENARGGLHSQRCFQNFQLEIARALRNQEFYFPHNIDFRGRAYPIPPYLNHMGADHCRGLLRFGQGRQLGESGLKWLKIHLANVFGYDKASLKEREAFATHNIDKIYDSASSPLEGSRWWLKAEDPWQCLAACIELRNALESPSPKNFVSHLPVHQDGTCNGLQHYAALGGDLWGAQQVNLEPGDRPADVYSAVAELVKKSIKADKEKGNPYAEILEGKITRKVVKQTVMTNVYGVTYIGAKAQVRKQLVAAYPDLPNEKDMHPGILASYIATKIFVALSTMFRGAHDIQYWLGECANRISQCLTREQMDRFEAEHLSASTTGSEPRKEKISSLTFEDSTQFKSSVIWTTPLHMPVVQPYRQTKSKIVQTNMQRISLSEPHQSNPVSKRKQLQGFPPNFIHSLDATHMLLSALQCDEKGLSFAAVHDSFWTHAADVDSMNAVLRDTFIRIHSENVIGRLAAEFSARYKDCMYLAKIRSGSLLYKKITSLRKTNRTTKGKASRLNELLNERRRCQLLSSSNPAEVEEGKKMVTPGSLFEQMSGERELVPEDDLAGMGIGEISPREARLQADEQIQVGDTSNVEEINNPLPGGTRVNTAMGHDMEDVEDLDEAFKSDEQSDGSDTRKTNFEKAFDRRSPAHSRDTWVWLPLTFPPVPKKVYTYLSSCLPSEKY